MSPMAERSAPLRDVKKVVLAYSGGLDTSIILKWLQTDLWLRGRHLHGRSRPGRRAGTRARKGADARHQAGQHLHRGPARRVRARLRVPDVPRQRAVRGPVPARHLDRPAADRQEADRDRRTRGRRRCLRMARPAKATIRCASNSPITRSNPSIKIIAPWREWSFKGRTDLIDFAERAPDPDRQGQGRRGAVLGRRQPAALVLRGQGAGGPRRRGAVDRLSAHHLADGGARPGDRHHASASSAATRSRSTARRCRPPRC